MTYLPVHAKRSVAAVLLGLFLFIHAEKLFHSHQHMGRLPSQITTTITAAAGCNICDFQLSKDAGLPALQVDCLPLPSWACEFESVASSIPSSYSGLVQGRGPPAM